MPEGLSLGPLLLRWNGLLIALGIAMGALFAAYGAKRRNFDPEIIYYLFLPLTVWGTIGARLWHIFTPPLSSVELGLTTGHYLTHPLDLIALWVGGLGLPGAMIGASIALYYFARKNELPFLELADVLAPGLVLAQAIGRLGNYFNQELYGLPTNLPWKIFIEPAYRLVGFESVEYYHPLFAYEMILNFGIMVLLLWLGRRFANTLRSGDIFQVYLGSYSLIRFLLEFLRLDIAQIYGININQVFFGIIFVLVGITLYLQHRPAKNL